MTRSAARSGHSERIEHVADRLRRCAGIGKIRKRPRTVLDLADQQGDALLFSDVFVRSQIPGGRYPCHRLAMARRILTHVERRQREAKRRDPSKDVGEPSGRDQTIAGPNERAMAQQQRRREVADVEQRAVAAGRVTSFSLRSWPRHMRVSRGAAIERSRSSARYGSWLSPTM